MKPEEFCRWLQGFAELNGDPPTPEQWKSIKEHLQLIYTKVTPPVTPGTLTINPIQLDSIVTC